MASMTSQPYIIAAVISAIPATLAATASWANARKGRKESHDGNDKMAGHLDNISRSFESIETRFERIDTNFAKLDLRLDSIEDKVERHLGWHRSNAEADLQQLIKRK